VQARVAEAAVRDAELLERVECPRLERRDEGGEARVAERVTVEVERGEVNSWAEGGEEGGEAAGVGGGEAEGAKLEPLPRGEVALDLQGNGPRTHTPNPH